MPVATTPTARTTHYLPTLDGWRAIAITLVLLHHIAPSLQDFFGSTARPLARFGLAYGGNGVNVFFAISGFLITTRLIDSFSTQTSVLRPFYIRRFYRILPPILAYLSVVALLATPGFITIQWSQLASCLFFYANYFHHGGTWTLGHFWTLAIEEHFYLIYPFLLAFTFRRPNRTLLITIVLAFLIAAWRSVDATYQLASPSLGPVQVRTDTQADGLLWGCAAALLYARGHRLSWLANPVVWYVLLAALLLSFRSHLDPFTSMLAGFFRPLLYAAVIVGTVLRPKGFFSRFLELPPLRHLGRMSYSLYLWQQLFLVWHGATSPYLHTVQIFPLNLLAAFLCAIASYYLIEKPFIREGYRVSSQYEKITPLTAAPLPVP